jgi:uncharacterized protein (TIGR03118 family)
VSISCICPKRLLSAGLVATLVLTIAGSAFAASYKQINLISDIAGAQQVDPNLVNPWGMASSARSPLWINENGTGFSSVFAVGNPINNPIPNPLVVTIPPPNGSPAGTVAAPTGIVFNGAGGFNVTNGTLTGPSSFIFATEDGTISGWSPSVDGTHAFIAVDNSQTDPADQQHRSAVYKGLAIAGTSIYAANFRGGFVEQYDSSFGLVRTFTDHTLPDSFAPFGIQVIGDKLFVTYAKTDSKKHDDSAGPGRGFVDVFDLNGNLLQRLIVRGVLNSPWGLALAPANFGDFSGALLVGNFGDGAINAFNVNTGAFLGQLKDSAGNSIVIDGLWGLRFGNGGAAGPANTLFFTAGIDHEAHGLFGSIVAQ